MKKMCGPMTEFSITNEKTQYLPCIQTCVSSQTQNPPIKKEAEFESSEEKETCNTLVNICVETHGHVLREWRSYNKEQKIQMSKDGRRRGSVGADTPRCKA